MTHRLLILTPSAGQVDIGYLDTMTRLERACHARGIFTNTMHAPNSGMLVNARNLLYVQAIRSDATDVLWWDSDVAFDVEHLLSVIDRTEDMIARPYPMKDTDWSCVEDLVEQLIEQARAGKEFRPPTRDELARAGIRWAAKPILKAAELIEPGALAPVFSSDGKLVELSYCGFGWVLMKIEAMRRFYEDVIASHADEDAALGPFDLRRNGQGVIIGEDMSFASRWRRDGRRIWAATDGTIQNGRAAGHFGEWLRARGWGFQPPVHANGELAP